MTLHSGKICHPLRETSYHEQPLLTRVTFRGHVRKCRNFISGNQMLVCPRKGESTVRSHKHLRKCTAHSDSEVRHSDGEECSNPYVLCFWSICSSTKSHVTCHPRKGVWRGHTSRHCSEATAFQNLPVVPLVKQMTARSSGAGGYRTFKNKNKNQKETTHNQGGVSQNRKENYKP